MKVFIYAFTYQEIIDGVANTKAVRIKFVVLAENFETAEKKCDALLASEDNDWEKLYQGREVIESLSPEYLVT